MRAADMMGAAGAGRKGDPLTARFLDLSTDTLTSRAVELLAADAHLAHSAGGS